MDWMTYRRRGAIGSTRVLLTRGRRRILLALLSDAGNLYLWQLCQSAQVGTARLCLFIEHLEQAGWLTRERRMADGRAVYCYSLTERGRANAMGTLHLTPGQQKAAPGSQAPGAAGRLDCAPPKA
jgi:DNA-binding MarR family transcriptional regulator